MSCNPWRNFIYTDFYKPWRDWELPERRKFIQSLPTDNPFLPKSYIEQLKNLDKVSRERLLNGNFDYSDDPWLLFDIDTLDNCFKKGKWTWEYYLTIDAARQGKDKTEIGVWNWLHLERIVQIERGNLTDQAETIQKLIQKHDIDLDNVIVDEVWVGWGLVDILWCKGFIANASPLHPYSAKLLEYKRRNYANLKTQAFFYLKKYIEDWKVTFYPENNYKAEIIEDLLFIRQVDIDNDSKIKLESKKDLKERLWRSPDLADMISFRMWWLIKYHHDWITPKEDLLDETEEQTHTRLLDEKIDEFLDSLWKEEQESWELTLWAF